MSSKEPMEVRIGEPIHLYGASSHGGRQPPGWERAESTVSSTWRSGWRMTPTMGMAIPRWIRTGPWPSMPRRSAWGVDGGSSKPWYTGRCSGRREYRVQECAMSSGVKSGGKIEASMALLRLVATSLIAAVFAVSTAYAQTPTLGELAKREQERRKAVKAPAKVLTAEQVPKIASPTPATLPAGAPADAKAEKPGGEVKDDPAQQEAAWKARMSALREELRRGEM